MTDLSTSYLGLQLRSPLVASASPMCGDLDGLRRLEDAGASAAVLPSLFEEQITHDSIELHRILETGADSFPEASSLFPELENYNTGPDAYLELIESAKFALSIPIIGSLNGITLGGWTEHARMIQDAGADALELNVYMIAADPATSSAQLETAYIELIQAVADSIDIPLAVKIGPYFTALANMATLISQTGAAGIVLFNRFYQPDIDIESLSVDPRLVLSTSDELRLVLRWLAILRPLVPLSLAATTGIHTGDDATKALLAGADVTMMASALIEHGPQRLYRVESELVEWMERKGYASVGEMRGSMSHRSIEDPTAFERANYMTTLTRFSNSFRA